MISAILFDLDGTLFDRGNSLIAFLADQHVRFVDRLGDAPFQAWRDRFLELDAHGQIHKSVVYPKLLSEFGGDLGMADALLRDYRERSRYFARGFPGMAETLRVLRLQGLKLGIVTNGETEFQTRHIDALGLDLLVDIVLISETEGLRKPDLALFHRAAERLGVEPSCCLFVGDNPTIDILGAHAAGMKTAWFKSALPWPEGVASISDVAIDALPELLDVIK
jgi:putative hydrolase of the HAD superfamily